MDLQNKSALKNLALLLLILTVIKCLARNHFCLIKNCRRFLNFMMNKLPGMMLFNPLNLEV